MQNVIAFGKRVVPLEQIAFVEAFDTARNPDFKPEKDFKARVVLLNRDMVLSEATPREFAETHGMRYLGDDDIAVNSAVAFKIETFMATDAFKPDRAYQTRLKWRDRNGHEQSKHLLTEPEGVIAMVLREGMELRAPRKTLTLRPSANRSSKRAAVKREPAHS